MQPYNKVSIYTDYSEQNKFIVQLLEIINREGSSISSCFLHKDLKLNLMSLYFKPFNSEDPFKCISFNFFNFFSDESQKGYNSIEYYLKIGFSQEDLELLSNFLSQYTFENRYEGLFFASTLFKLKNSDYRIKNMVLKFLPDELSNQYVIEDKYLNKFYSLINKSDLKNLLKDCEFKSDLIGFNSYSLDESNLDSCIKKFEKRQSIVPTPEYLLVEYYKNFENYESYVSKVYDVIESELVPISIKDILI